MITLILLIVSGCSPRDAYQAGSAGVDDKPATATGVTVFGDAQIGATIN